MTSHPKDMSDDLILAHGDVPQLMPYLHLPVQSGSDKMLRAMNRKHDSNFYLKIIEKLKHSRPDIALSSDFIVGHPEESNEDFAATLRLISEVNYSQAYSFKYSPRPGTPASAAEQIPEDIKSDRLQTLQQLLGEQQLAFNIQCTGSSQKVLVEKQREWDGHLSGRSPFMQTVHFDGPSRLVGQIVNVKIKGGSGRSLSGRVAIRQDDDQNIKIFQANI
jgi:tRNA-2-methylthio-N6-dimethylallyladenosine synthase